MRDLVFAFALGVILAAGGLNVLDRPIRTYLTIAVIYGVHLWAKG